MSQKQNVIVRTECACAHDLELRKQCLRDARVCQQNRREYVALDALPEALAVQVREAIQPTERS